MKQITEPFRNWRNYTGTTNRNDFLVWCLFWILTAYVLPLLISNGQGIPTPIVVALYSIQLITLPPTIALMVRRAHDTGKSGKFLLAPIALITTAIAVDNYITHTYIHATPEPGASINTLNTAVAITPLILIVIALAILATLLVEKSKTKNNPYLK